MELTVNEDRLSLKVGVKLFKEMLRMGDSMWGQLATDELHLKR